MNETKTKDLSPVEGKERLQIPLSLVKGVMSSKITGYSTLKTIVDDITDNRKQSLIDFTNELRAAKKEDAIKYKELKESQCMGFIVGKYTQRLDNDCTMYVPLVGFDIDGIEDEFHTDLHLSQARKSPYVFLAFPSPSGQGLRLFIWCNTKHENHKNSYSKVCDYLSDFLNISTDKTLRKELKDSGLSNVDIKAKMKITAHIDTGTKNPARIWFYSHVDKDDLWLNLNSNVFVINNKKVVSQLDNKTILRPQATTTQPSNNLQLDSLEKIRICELMADNRYKGSSRNERLFSLACIMYEHGLQANEILGYCNRYAEDDFNKSEIKKTVNSAVKKATFQRFTDKQMINWRNSTEGKAVEATSVPIQTNKVKSTSTILNELYKGLKKVKAKELRIKAGLGEKGVIKVKHWIVTIVDEVLEQAKAKKYGLCRVHDFVYLYNGCYWETLDKEHLKYFLGEASAKLGYNRIDAKYFEFRDKLHKQFLSAGNFTRQKANRKLTLINLQNGTFEIGHQQSRLREFKPDDFITYQLPFNYNPTATSPLFDQYIKRVLPDEASRKVLAEYIGYVFIKDLKLEKCLLLYGSGANGKSVFFEIVNALLGSQNISNFSLGNLTEENNRALINNKLLNYGSEIRGSIESDVFKQLVSCEPVQARLKYGNSFIMTDYAKLAFNCNTLPKDIEHNEAYFRRFLIVPFEVTIPKSERDPELSYKIISSEMSGVFNWILSGLQRVLRQKGFSKSDAVQKAIDKYRKNSDTVQLFLEDYGYEKSAEHTTLLKHLYFQYKNFCIEDGYKQLGNRNFKNRLEALQLYPVRTNKGLHVPVVKK